MKKRTFIKKMGQGAALTLASALLPHAWAESRSLPPSPTKNWMWARPQQGLGKEGWQQKIALAKSSGIDAVLVEVYNGTNAFFENDRFPVVEPLLETLIPICQAEGVELHAWMWTMICRNQTVMDAHPDWYAVNRKGESAYDKPAYVDYYRFMCPAHPEVREFVKGNVQRLAAFEGLTGVHLDYVRLPDVILAEGLQPKYNIVQDKEYPAYDYCYSEYTRKAFKEETGIDPLLDLADPTADQAWRQFRYDLITSLVNGELVPEAKKQGKMITAAVFPNWESVRQNWHQWKLDAFLPMLYHEFYNESYGWIKKETKDAVTSVAGGQPIYSGLFVPSFSPETLAKGRKAALKGGASGITLFDMGAMTDAHWQAVKGLLVEG